MESADSHPDTTFVLYLNEHTFVGPAGERLAEEVRRTLAANRRLFLAHENEEAKGGCAFDRFFQTTPKDLIVAGVYRDVATAFYGRPFRDLSIALAMKALGATEGRLRRSRTVRSRLKVVTRTSGAGAMTEAQSVKRKGKKTAHVECVGAVPATVSATTGNSTDEAGNFV